jgi:ABC-type glycerol-3-phosphate transport system substrate-binding protein
MDEFASATPGIGRVEFDAGFNLNADQFAEQYDCFVLPYNAAPDLDPTTLLNLDPFLDADSSFRRDDFVSGALEAVQRDNRTWALPLVIQPASLSYDIDQFEQAGVPLPAGSWTIDAFTDALHALKPSAADPAPFGPTFTGDYLLMLIAAYGGLPLDSNTDPVTVNFTDPANVDAIRQVLDLARDGYINYQALEMVSGARSISVSLSNDSLPAITSDIIGPGLFVVGEMGEGGEDTTGLTTYPQGTTYIPVSYSMQTGYISANAENPQACYLWLKTIAQHPEVLGQMPARRSQLDDPAVEAAFGANAMAFYRAFSDSLDAPNALVISPGAMVLSDASAETVLVQNWLNRAFDRYVLEDADLETELAEAQTLATTFQTCLGELPADASDEERGVRLVECALMVDPDMQTLFGDGE